MEAYAGFEPRVGEIRALRTFRIGAGGVLFPLFSDTPWADGQNTAQCLMAPADNPADPSTGHRAPEPDCACGLYAYANAAAAEHPQARHVLAVVACWGRIIAGTRGIRAEHARLEAIWMSEAVPCDLAAMVATSYPSATTYGDVENMLSAHSPTVLDCYEPEMSRQHTKQFAVRLTAALGVVISLLPTHWLGGYNSARAIWAGELSVVFVAMALAWPRHSDVASKLRVLMLIAMAIWVAAPLGGAAATYLLRVPLILIGALALLDRRLGARAAGRFPAQIGTSGD